MDVDPAEPGQGGAGHYAADGAASLERRRAYLAAHRRHERVFDHWPHWTPEHATLLANFTSPVWIYDLDNHAMFWGNSAAVALWRKNDLEHFLATDYKSDLSEATKLRLWGIDDKLFNHGESVFDQWTFYPNNADGERTAITVDCHCFGIYLPNGYYGFYVEGIPRAASKPLPAAAGPSTNNLSSSTNLAAPSTGNLTAASSSNLSSAGNAASAASLPSTSTSDMSASSGALSAADMISAVRNTPSGVLSLVSQLEISSGLPSGSVPSGAVSGGISGASGALSGVSGAISGSVHSGTTSGYVPPGGIPANVWAGDAPTPPATTYSEMGDSSVTDTHSDNDLQMAQIRERNLRTVESFHQAPYCILLLRPLPASAATDAAELWARPGQDMVMQNPEAMRRFGPAWSFWASWADRERRNGAIAELQARGASSDEALLAAREGTPAWFRFDARVMNDPATAGTLLLVFLVDISQQKSLEGQLVKARADAEAGNLAKSEFLAIMSHEIRTPLNSIIGMTTLLMDTEKTMTPEQSKCVGLIRSSGDSLLSIIDDILDFSKIESGKYNLHLEPFPIRRMIEEVMDLFRSQSVTRQLRLTHCVAPSVPEWVRGDEKRLRQVLWNILANAVKFSKTGGYVSVIVDRDESLDGGVRFAVTDTGIGIPQEKIGVLFSPFTQADSSVNRRFGGSGLGLALVKRLVGLMGGHIEVTSVVGRGSTFTFSICAPDAGHEAAAGSGYFGHQPTHYKMLASSPDGGAAARRYPGTTPPVHQQNLHTPPVPGAAGARLLPFRLNGTAVRSPGSEEASGSLHGSPGVDLELTSGKRFAVVIPDVVSRGQASTHLSRELGMVCAGEWASADEARAHLESEQLDLIVVHRSLGPAERDPYETLPRREGAEGKRALDGGRRKPSAIVDDGGVGQLLRASADAQRRKFGRRPAVVMTSWLAVAGTSADQGATSAAQMFVPSASEFDDVVDAHIYIPYRSSSMVEAVVQALDSAKLANTVATGAPASAPLPSGSASEAAPDGAAGGAPKRRRETKGPASEIDHTLGKRLPMRILAVDDNSVNLLLATRFLEKMGFEGVQCADDGKVAIEMVEEAIRAGLPFELILMDVNMPVIDGLTASREIIAYCESLGLMPPVIIAVTADISEISQARSIDSGMRGTLTKPIRIQSMQETLMAIGQELLLQRQQNAFSLRLGEDETPALVKNRLERSRPPSERGGRSPGSGNEG